MSSICLSNIGPNFICRSLLISIKIPTADICDLLFLSNCLIYRVHISSMTDKIKSIHEISPMCMSCWHRDVNPLWPGNNIWHDTYQSSWYISDFVLCQYAIRPSKHFHHFFTQNKNIFIYTHSVTSYLKSIFMPSYIFPEANDLSKHLWQWWQFIYFWLSVLIVQSWQTTHCPAKMLHGGHWSGQPSIGRTVSSLKYNTFTSLTHLPLGDVVEILLKIRFHGVMTVYLFAICIDCPVFANLDAYTNLACGSRTVSGVCDMASSGLLLRKLTRD